MAWIVDHLVYRAAQGLERGEFANLAASSLSRAWELAAATRVVRRLALPAHARVVAVGGSTLGGSWKTPLAIACAAEIAATGAAVAFVGHAYRARPARARIVEAGDALNEVGDEALVAAHALAPSGVRVVVAPTRAGAVAFAAGLADVLVLDGVAQTAPARASLALLAVDAVHPWGQAAAMPPRGDLRAPVGALLSACDVVVAVGVAQAPHLSDQTPETCHARVVMRGAWRGDVLLRWEDLAGLRVGLLCALARPDRLVRSLAARGIRPRAVLCTCDHGALGPQIASRAARLPIDLWLATPKCITHMTGNGHRLSGFVATIDHAVRLPAALRARLAAVAVP